MSDAAPQGGALISVIGGGAVGGLLAALLARAGSSVELIVREHYQEKYQAGIRVTTGQGTFRQQLPIRTIPSPCATLIVVAVKMPDLETTCRQIAAGWPSAGRMAGGIVPQEPDVLLLQNGLDALDLAARYLPLKRLYGAVVELGATALTPAEITYSIPGRLLIGAADAGRAGRAHSVADLLAPGLRTNVTPDVYGAQRLKLLVNLNNGIGAATGLTIQQLYAGRTGIKVSLSTMREGLAVLDAAGRPPPVNRRSRALRIALGLPDAFGVSALRLARVAMRQRAPVYTSTLQSVLRQRPSEISWLNGAIVRLGYDHAVPTPLNNAIVAAVEALEIGSAGAGYVTPRALLTIGAASAAADALSDRRDQHWS